MTLEANQSDSLQTLHHWWPSSTLELLSISREVEGVYGVKSSIQHLRTHTLEPTQTHLVKQQQQQQRRSDTRPDPPAAFSADDKPPPRP